MDISIAPASANTTPKSPEQADTETQPTRVNPSSKPLSFTNGVLKRHHRNLDHNHLTVSPVLGAVSYKECLKNHAASLGGHALDGCGEFMPSPMADKNDPTSLKCAACGCHRNFHRREPEDPLPPPNAATHFIEYQPHHRHHPLPPAPPQHQPASQPGLRSRNSVSPPPISSYYPSAPHMLLALSGGMSAQPEPAGAVVTPSPISRKRFRTKFSQTQKEKMHQFADKVGWKMQKRDEDLVQEFCNEIGVEKGVFKVWMHNNKNTYGKKDDGATTGTTTNSLLVDHFHDNNILRNISNDNIINNNNNNNINNGSENVNQYQNDNVGHVVTNGSSSSS